MASEHIPPRRTATKTADVPRDAATAAKPASARSIVQAMATAMMTTTPRSSSSTLRAKATGAAEHGASSTRQSSRVVHDPAPGDDDDAEVEIVQSGARQESGARSPATPDAIV